MPPSPFCGLREWTIRERESIVRVRERHKCRCGSVLRAGKVIVGGDEFGGVAFLYIKHRLFLHFSLAWSYFFFSSCSPWTPEAPCQVRYFLFSHWIVLLLKMNLCISLLHHKSLMVGLCYKLSGHCLICRIVCVLWRRERQETEAVDGGLNERWQHRVDLFLSVSLFCFNERVYSGCWP